LATHSLRDAVLDIYHRTILFKGASSETVVLAGVALNYLFKPSMSFCGMSLLKSSAM